MVHGNYTKSWVLVTCVSIFCASSNSGFAQQTLTGAIETQNGHFVTAVNGGGLGGPNTGPNATALHTDATTPLAWETFTLRWVDTSACKFALQTVYGKFVTAVNGGGIGGPNTSQSPIHTDATTVGSWESFKLLIQQDGTHAFIQTPDGQHYLTAVNGGNFGGPNNVPIHTDATTLGPLEQFVFKSSTSFNCSSINAPVVVTRRDFAVQMQQQFNLPQPSTPINFPDVPRSDPAYLAVEAAAPYMNMQILCPTCMFNPKFFPDYPVSNAVEAITLVRLLQSFSGLTLLDAQTSETVLSNAADASGLKSPARPYLATAIQNGILVLQSGNTISLGTELTESDFSARISSLQTKFKFPHPSPVSPR